LHDNAEVPETVEELNTMLAGVTEHERPGAGLTVAESATVPTNPLALVTATVEVPEVPPGMVTDAGPTDSVKSCTVYATKVECDKPAPVPVTVTVYDPTGPLQDRVVLLLVLTVIDDGFKEQLNPVDGDTVTPRFTVPVNPSKPVAVMVDGLGFPA
jgi:hypothetical protein